MIVFFYGGSWQTGARSEYGFVAARLARRGFVVAVPDYRLFPEAVFPAFLEDAASAVAWMFRHASEFGGNSAELFLIGHSAGAYNAVMLGAGTGVFAWGGAGGGASNGRDRSGGAV